MKNRNHIFTFSIVLSLLFCFAFPLFAQEGTGKPSNKAVNQKIGKLQIPFIANEGQADKKVAFYANTFGGTVFVTNEGEIVYSLPKGSDVENTDCRGELHSPNGTHDTGCGIHENRDSCIKSCTLDEACPDPAKRPCPEPVEWAECTQQINDSQPPTPASSLQGRCLKRNAHWCESKGNKG